jgi:hypothetical protein
MERAGAVNPVVRVSSAFSMGWKKERAGFPSLVSSFSSFLLGDNQVGR